MGVYQKNNHWYIDYYAKGVRKRERVYGSKRDAERALHKRKIQVMEGKFYEIEKLKAMKLKELIRIFLETYSKPNKSSWRDDEIHLNRACSFFGDINISEVTPLKVEEFKRWRLEGGVKRTTVNRNLQVLKTMFYKAMEWGYSKDNPIKKVKLYKEDNRRLRFLEREEIERLLNACSLHTRKTVVFALNTGMRRGEMLNLKWSDISLKNNLIYIHKTKTKTKRVIPMNSAVKRLLLNIRERSTSEYIFCNEEGGQIKSLRKGFEKALNRAGINDFRWHDLRHSFASHLVMSGIDLNTVKELLGHKTIDMTLRYSHLSQDHKSRAVEVLGRRIDTIWSPVAKKKKDDILYHSEVIENKSIKQTAPVAQLDRASGFGPEGCRFDSCRARGFPKPAKVEKNEKI